MISIFVGSVDKWQAQGSQLFLSGSLHRIAFRGNCWSLICVNQSTRPLYFAKPPCIKLYSSPRTNQSCGAHNPRLAASINTGSFQSQFFRQFNTSAGRRKKLILNYSRQSVVGCIWCHWFGMANISGALLALFVAFSMCVPQASASSPEEAFIKKTVASNDIVIFSKSYCPYCRRAKAVFKELNKTPHVIELDERDDGMNIQDALIEVVGRRTVPQVFVKGKHIGGSDDTVEAYESGALAKFFDSSKDDL